MRTQTLVACLLVSAFVSASAACGGDSKTTSPSAPQTPTAPTPTTPAPAAPTWTINGRVQDTTSQAAIAGATITPSWDLAAVTSKADGSFTLESTANPPTTPYAVSISADGYLTRKQWVTWQRGVRNGITFDLLRDTAPFSMDFYRQLARGTYDAENSPWRLLRWTAAPSFYVKTVDQNGRAIEPEVMNVVLSSLIRAVPLYTGNTYGLAAIESGETTRLSAANWINVNILRDPNERRTCGRAYVGTNPGEITLYDDVCSCGSVKIPGSVVLHEVGHALGFFHVADRNSVMYPTVPGNCPPGEPSAAERFHVGVAYLRPRGNTDPDDDPSSSALLHPMDGEASPRLIVN